MSHRMFVALLSTDSDAIFKVFFYLEEIQDLSETWLNGFTLLNVHRENRCGYRRGAWHFGSKSAAKNVLSKI